jgi:hypothetical protein
MLGQNLRGNGRPGNRGTDERGGADHASPYDESNRPATSGWERQKLGPAGYAGFLQDMGMALG